MPHGPGPFLLDPNTPPFPSGQAQPGPGQGGPSLEPLIIREGTMQDFIEGLRELEWYRIGKETLTGGEAADVYLGDFYAFADAMGLPADPLDQAVTDAYWAEFERQSQQAAQTQAAGAASRIQFESERALQQEQAQSLRFGRVRDKLDLAMATDQLADARRALAVSALLEAAPRMVNPGQEFFPGQEPGGAGQELARLLGVGFEPQRIPTTTLPLQELVDAPLAVPPEMIFSELGALQ